MAALADPLQGLGDVSRTARCGPPAGWVQRTFSGAEPLDNGMLRVDVVLAVEDAATFAARAGRTRRVHVAAGSRSWRRRPARWPRSTGRRSAPVGPATDGHDADAVGRPDRRRAVPEQLRAWSRRTSTGARSPQWSAASTSVYRSPTRHGSWWAACSPGCEADRRRTDEGESTRARRSGRSERRRGRHGRRVAGDASPARSPSRAPASAVHDARRPRPRRRARRGSA